MSYGFFALNRRVTVNEIVSLEEQGRTCGEKRLGKFILAELSGSVAVDGVEYFGTGLLEPFGAPRNLQKVYMVTGKMMAR